MRRVKDAVHRKKSLRGRDDMGGAKHFSFEPKPNIKTYELALCIKHMFIMEKAVDNLDKYLPLIPKGARRHIQFYTADMAPITTLSETDA